MLWISSRSVDGHHSGLGSIPVQAASGLLAEGVAGVAAVRLAILVADLLSGVAPVSAARPEGVVSVEAVALVATLIDIAAACAAGRNSRTASRAK